MKSFSIKPDLKKARERTSRVSLTLVLAIFVFLILVVAIAMAALGLWALTKTGVLLDVDGELRLSSVIVFMAVISLVIGEILAVFSSRIPLKPINELINKMNRLAVGDFKARLSFGNTLSSHPAAKEISHSFNSMATQLENTALLHSDFINNFSHEFKTPIVSITGFAGLLEHGDLTEEQRSTYLRSIREESARLAAMATNVLNLSKIENQTVLTDISRFNLSEQVRSAVLLLEDKWTKKEIDLQLDFLEYEIEASEELLKEVWINLMDNAVKFSPQGGTVELEIVDEGACLAVSFTNSAPDIPKEKLEKLFYKFYQADESHATKGNGIGLAVVSRVIALHNGEIAVLSEGGKTCFTVRVPKHRT